MGLLSFMDGGLRTKPHADASYLQLGADALNWQQEEAAEVARQAVLGQLISTGLLVSRDTAGRMGPEWMPYVDPGTPGDILIGDAAELDYQTLVDSHGYVVTAPMRLTPSTSNVPPYAEGISVPNDSTWRTLVVRVARTRYLPGYVSFTGASADITCSGEIDFTRLSGKTTNGLPFGTRLRVDEDDDVSLAGTYYIDEVTDSTNATLTAVAPADGVVRVSVVGTYQVAEPSTEADMDIYQRLVPEFELVTRTTSPAAGDMIIADVWFNGSDTKIYDRRSANLAHVRPGIAEPGWVPALMPTFALDTTSAFTGVTLQEAQVATADNGVGDITAVPLYDPSTYGAHPYFLLAYNVVTLNTLLSATYTPNVGTNSLGTLTPAGTIYATGTGSTPSALAIQTGARVTGGTTETTVLVAYHNAGKIYIKNSTGGGATWSGGLSATWDPTTIDASDTVTDPFLIRLRNGRVLCVGIYYDNSATNKYSIRNIYSDDGGATWSVNSHNGVTNVSATNTRVRKNPCMAQDPNTGRIWLAYEEVNSGVTNISVGTKADETGQSSFSNMNIAVINDAVDSGTPSDQCEPALWMAPNGLPVCIYVDRLLGGSGVLDLRYAVLGFGVVRSQESEPTLIRELSNCTIQRLTDRSTHGADITTSTRVRPCVMQSHTGGLWVFYTEPGPSGGGPVDLYMAKSFAVVRSTFGY